ncbi:hypothetical protein RQP54_19340 [Curvibacter sp. APW13]|uniref:hypothetical protein n=1 Tax=Curvibacter sp. APW13 TaxID=3077236 RepID=UPI0028DE6C9E|nr:hypothetical protein [Curvibacter sp. APW13]MDT8993036.1 hypothetical protein [Curvibacter sp. APW13]
MELEEKLSQVECSLDLAFGALLAGDTQALLAHTEAVLAGSQSLAAAQDTAPNPAWRACAQRVQILREALARCQIQNEMMLHHLVPAFQQPTYGGAAVAGARPVVSFSGVPRASGRMEQVLRA